MAKEFKVKEISEINENGKNMSKVVFSDSDKDTEIIFEGNGKIKIPVNA